VLNTLEKRKTGMCRITAFGGQRSQVKGGLERRTVERDKSPGERNVETDWQGYRKASEGGTVFAH